MARRLRKASTAGPLDPSLSVAAAGTLFQPPLVTMPWYFWIATSVAASVRGDSSGVLDLSTDTLASAS